MMDEILLFFVGMLAGYYLKTLLFAEKTAWFVENLEGYRKELHEFYEQGNQIYRVLDKVLYGFHQAGILTSTPIKPEVTAKPKGGN